VFVESRPSQLKIGTIDPILYLISLVKRTNIPLFNFKRKIGYLSSTSTLQHFNVIPLRVSSNLALHSPFFRTLGTPHQRRWRITPQWCHLSAFQRSRYRCVCLNLSECTPLGQIRTIWTVHKPCCDRRCFRSEFNISHQPTCEELVFFL
jgi:hypothetical protein